MTSNSTADEVDRRMIGGRIAIQMVLGVDSFTAGIIHPAPSVITTTAIIFDLDNCLSQAWQAMGAP